MQQASVYGERGVSPERLNKLRRPQLARGGAGIWTQVFFNLAATFKKWGLLRYKLTGNKVYTFKADS